MPNDPITTITNAYHKGTLHHAYLFVGLQLSPTREPVEHFLSHLPPYDIIRCMPSDENETGTISIEQIRHVIYTLTRIAEEGRMRVIWIDPASSLTKEAANALLKILEEPPPQTLFLLFTNSIRAVLPTIVSRTSIIRLPPPNRAEISKLRDTFLKENGQAEHMSLLAGDTFTKLSRATSLEVSSLASFEYSLDAYIASAKTEDDYTNAVRSYFGFCDAVHARRCHVSEQGCIDLLWL